MRYKTTKTDKKQYSETSDTGVRKGGFSKYNTTIYNEIPDKNDDMYFRAQDGDRLDLLAHRFYGDAKLWWFLARVNNLKTMNVPEGTSLKIPSSPDNAKGS